ncbi:glucoamylase family protein [Mesorhizobium sp. SB112]|uniref:glucoamylase family protein n=1 Tax=Mesorhizobium sp. SB112 TaxID=3151853 RepID=UPI00326486C4
MDSLNLGFSADDETLLERVQRQTFRYFWEGAHPASGWAYDRRLTAGAARNDLVSTAGVGFGIMVLIVAAEREWLSRATVIERLDLILTALENAPRFHGAFSHFLNGKTGEAVSFSKMDDGGDIVETSLLMQGVLCARQYFTRDTPSESAIRDKCQKLWNAVEWNWYTKSGRKTLYWHWSPKYQFRINLPVRGWNEGIIAYVMAAGAERPIEPTVFHNGFALNGGFRNEEPRYGMILTLGQPDGGPLFLVQSAFCGLDPRAMKDRYADYWEQAVTHTRINIEHAVRNPKGHKGYGADCWGLSASHGPKKYLVGSPDHDRGIVTPTAALSSMPYAPLESLRAMRHFLDFQNGKLWGRYGFVDAFASDGSWISKTCLAINQGPIIAMIENFRSGLLWKLFMSAPEIQTGLDRLDFMPRSSFAQNP